jgi:hypothetical protein
MEDGGRGTADSFASLRNDNKKCQQKTNKKVAANDQQKSTSQRLAKTHQLATSKRAAANN